MVAALLILGAHKSLLDHAFDQWRETPEMRVEDAYKWLFHATLGGEHAVTSEHGPRAWLDREWPTLGPPKEDEEELVPLTPDRSLVRVNLRPYKARNGDKEMLLWAFVLSAERFQSERSDFVAQWDALGERLRSSKWNRLTAAEWRRLDAAVRKEGFPAIDHSEQYEWAYQPAYRVVLRELWSG